MSPRQKEPLTYEYALLGFLFEEPQHAYAVHQQMMQSPLGQVWRIKQSALYAMITRLHDETCLIMTADEDDARGKRTLIITEAGKHVFAEWCHTPVAHLRDMRIEYLAKLYFVMRCYPQRVSELLIAQHRVCQEWLTQLHEQPHRDDYQKLVHAYRRGQIEAAIQWTSECQRLLTE